jgi:hypothetical protein
MKTAAAMVLTCRADLGPYFIRLAEYYGFTVTMISIGRWSSHLN